jgi:hypothetical protein
MLIMLIGAVAATPAVSSAAQPATPVLTNIRTGLNTGFDRIVLDLSGPAPTTFSSRGVDELTSDPSGEIVWLTGQFFTEVPIFPAAAHDQSGQSTYPGPAKFRTRDLHNVMAVAITGDFEGHLTIGLGTRFPSWVRVFSLAAPTRVVIDIGN